jgi:predicted ATPase
MTTSTLWTTVKDELRERREGREALNKLRADLEHYRTPADIDDLLASVDEQDTPEAELIRGILSENLRAYHSRRAVSA